MRTTVTLDSDVLEEVQRIRRTEGLGLSEALNQLARRAMATKSERRVYQPRSVDLGLRIDVSNVGDVLEPLDDET